MEDKESNDEITSLEISEACLGVLDQETCNEIAAFEDTEEALGYTFSALIEAGIEDPEEFLKSKEILE